MVKYPNSIAIFGYFRIDSHAFLAPHIDRLTSFGRQQLYFGGVEPLNLRTRFLRTVKGTGNYRVAATAGAVDGCPHLCF
jgi:hypothetical protein